MIGIDIISIDRISKAKIRFGDRFARRFLNEDEIKLVKNDSSLAGFWAAKEAGAKALGLGIGKECSFFDMVICKNKNGAPNLIFSNHLNIAHSSLSISHDANMAIAACIVEFKKEIDGI